MGQKSVEVELALASGDVLVMRGDLQRTHVHKVPREESPTGPRINLTFRRLNGDAAPLRAAVEHSTRVVPWPFD